MTRHRYGCGPRCRGVAEVAGRSGWVWLASRALLATIPALAWLVGVLGTARVTAADGSDPVVATVGSHQITQSEVDRRIRNKLYDLRKSAIDSMADEYLLTEAAKHDHVSVADYVNRNADRTAKQEITETTARDFYQQHKAEIGAPFDQIKSELIAALRRREVERARERLLEQLRQAEPVRILLKAPRLEIATAGHPELGNRGAPVTLVEFGDFQCPFCERSEATLKKLRDKYGDKLRLVFLDFPLSFHAHAMDAANAARCAGEQGRFWPYHDLLFAGQKRLDPAGLKEAAKQAGLDTAKFDACFKHDKYQDAIRKDIDQGETLGVDGTPTFFINGVRLVGAQPTSAFEKIIDRELARAQTGNGVPHGKTAHAESDRR